MWPVVYLCRVVMEGAWPVVYLCRVVMGPVVYVCRVVMEEQCGQWCTCVGW